MDEIRNTIVQVETLKSKKQFHTAITTIQQALIRYPDDYRLYEELADMYLYMSEPKKALWALDIALELHPKSATGNYLKWFILLSEDQLHEAILYLEISNTLFGNNAEVLRNLGWAYTMSNQYERGISILKRALNISPEDELITEDLAMALIWAGEVKAGNKLLETIWKSSTTNT